MRTFSSGATRDNDDNKLDFEGFLSPFALEAYAQYMHGHRIQADGNLRESDNWQKGIPVDQYMKSLWRHFFAVWKGHRQGEIDRQDVCAMLFNGMGILHEIVAPTRQDSRNPEAHVQEATVTIDSGAINDKQPEETRPERSDDELQQALDDLEIIVMLLDKKHKAEQPSAKFRTVEWAMITVLSLMLASAWSYAIYRLLAV